MNITETQLRDTLLLERAASLYRHHDGGMARSSGHAAEHCPIPNGQARSEEAVPQFRKCESEPFVPIPRTEVVELPVHGFGTACYRAPSNLLLGC